MNDTNHIQNRLLDQATQEQSLRKRIVETLLLLLRNPMVGKDLKILIILDITIIIACSFYTTILGIYALCKKLPRFEYVLLLLGLFALLIAFTIPLLFKASSTEAALRLSANFDKISDVKLGH